MTHSLSVLRGSNQYYGACHNDSIPFWNWITEKVLGFAHASIFRGFSFQAFSITSIETLPPGQKKEGFYAGVSLLPVNEKLAEIFV